MAKVTGRDRMIASVESFTGDGTCSEAILMQERPAWAPVLFIPAFLIIYIASLAFDLPTFVAAGLAGAAGAGTFVVLTTYWILARVGNDVVLAESSKWSAKATAIHAQVPPAPHQHSLENALLSKKLNFGGSTYYVARQFVSRAEGILS